MKKDQKRFWSPDCKMAFDKLKRAIASEPVLQLQDYSRGTHRCLRLSRVLVQGGSIRKPKAKQNRESKSIPVQEKEMTAVVHSLRIWRLLTVQEKKITAVLRVLDNKLS